MSMVVVFESGDLGRFEIAKSLLQANGITFAVSGEILQDLVGGGRIGGANVLTGPARLGVAEEDAEKARELLSDLLADNG